MRTRYGIELHEFNLKTETFIRRSRIEASAAVVYAWHDLPDALERLTPPGEHVKIIEKAGGIERGARVVLRFGRWPFQRRWVAEHQEYEEGRYFSDVQVSGPFAYWKHTHTFEPDGPSACFLEDRVEYALPFGFLGRGIAGWYVRRSLAKLFEYRQNVTRQCILNSIAAKF
jgi:ligand-binding SRPBCC domain-containing protein